MGSANNLIDIKLHNQEVRSKIATNDREERGLHAPKCPTHFQRVNIAVKHPVNVAKIVLFLEFKVRRHNVSLKHKLSFIAAIRVGQGEIHCWIP